LAAGTYKSTELIRRQEHSCFREFFRLGTILAKLQAEDSAESLEDLATGAEKAEEMPQPDSDGLAGSEYNSAVSGPELVRSEQSSALPESGQVHPDSPPAETGEHGPAPACPPATTYKNEGASGDVDENTGGGESEVEDFQHFAPQEAADLPGERGNARVQQASR
jgi:hypothetical protein